MTYLCSYFQVRPGAVQGMVEIAPLAHAAALGMTGIVDLLLKNGANVNLLCSVRTKVQLTSPSLLICSLGFKVSSTMMVFVTTQYAN